MPLVKTKSLFIKDTTKQERQEIVTEAITLGTIECRRPPEAIIKLYQLYVAGLMELAQVKEKILLYINLC